MNKPVISWADKMAASMVCPVIVLYLVVMFDMSLVVRQTVAEELQGLGLAPAITPSVSLYPQ